MRYHQKLEVSGPIVDAIEELCRGNSGEGRDIEFDQSVDFGNGYIMDIQVCQGDDGYWTQGVLYRKAIGRPIEKGPVYNEVACTDVGESFAGEYHVWHDGNEYVGEIVRKRSEK